MHPFQIMSEPIRRRLIEVLCVGEHSFGDLAGVVTVEFGVTKAAASWHLAILKRNGWVSTREEWPWLMYRLNGSAIKQLKKEIKWLENLWAHRYGTVERRPMPPSALRSNHGRRRTKRTAKRLPSGTAKGLRGASRKNDPWGPRA